jgi:hypothetical protein
MQVVPSRAPEIICDSNLGTEISLIAIKKSFPLDEYPRLGSGRHARERSY